MRTRIFQQRIHLAHTFTTSHGSSDWRENVFLEIEHDGVVGYGLAAPNPRFGETPESTIAALEGFCKTLPESPRNYVAIMRAFSDSVAGAYAAKAALDIALLDWLGKSLNAPLYRIWGLDPVDMPPTSMTIGMDRPEVMRELAAELGAFHVLKIKLGSSDDRAMIRAIREVADQPIRVDANEGWRDREAAIRDIEWYATQNVEFIEQPMPAVQREDMAWLKARSPLPLIADEAFTVPSDLLHLHEQYHGVNIKLMKSGGPQTARRAIDLARELGMRTMLGVMVESSVGVAAAAHLAPLVDYADLDGHLLLKDDPFDGLPVQEGKLVLSDRPGLGVYPSREK